MLIWIKRFQDFSLTIPQGFRLYSIQLSRCNIQKQIISDNPVLKMLNSSLYVLLLNSEDKIRVIGYTKIITSVTICP